MWLSGKTRHVGRAAVIGFHGISNDENKASFNGNVEVAKYLLKTGLSHLKQPRHCSVQVMMIYSSSPLRMLLSLGYPLPYVTVKMSSYLTAFYLTQQTQQHVKRSIVQRAVYSRPLSRV
jgi:hypothetical protein